MARLIHLNGPPGIGKSTIARRFVSEHRGVLNCDVDVLRTLIGGWSHDFAAAGALIRPAAIAMITAYLASGHDVVLPQLLVDPAELARFEECAAQTESLFLERVLMDEPESAAARFERRGETDADVDPWHDQVRAIVATAGGADALLRYHEGLERLIAHRPGTIVIPSIEGQIEETYHRFLASI